MVTFKDYINEQEESDEQDIFYKEGVYISVKLDPLTEKYVKEYQDKYLKNANINSELHCTLIYSKKPYKEEITPTSYNAIGTFKEFSLFGEDNNILVVEVISPELHKRNKDLVDKYGFISDFGEYKSHITLAYEATNIDTNSLPPMDFAFNFVNERVKKLNTDWLEDKLDKKDKK